MTVQNYIAGANTERMQVVRLHEAQLADLQETIVLLEHQLRIASSKAEDGPADVTRTGTSTTSSTASARTSTAASGARPAKRPKTIADLLQEE
jgi:hypothetical protein